MPVIGQLQQIIALWVFLLVDGTMCFSGLW